LVQRLALKKISKKLDKLAAQSPQLKQRDAAAGTARVGGNLRSAIIFGIVGLLLTLLGGIAGIFYVLGVIFIVIGLVFLLLWVLDEA
jgi:Na+/melibiose symporter-like transporter